MCSPIVTSAVSSALRIAELRRTSHSRADGLLGGIDTVGVLVAEVPRPDRLVPREGGGSLCGKENLSIADRRIAVPVAQPSSHDGATGHDPEARISVRATERPGRDPVHSAHVAGEEGGDQRQPEPGGEVGDNDETPEHLAVYPVRGRLEVFPGEKHPHGVETAGGDPRKVGFDLRRVEARPPAHRGGRRPVVDADPEELAPGFRAQRTASMPISCVAVEVDDALDRGRGSRPPSARRRSGSPPKRARLPGRGSSKRRTAATASSCVIDEEPVLAVTDDLRHRAAPRRDDRRPAGHRLDDAEAERLVEVDEVQQCSRPAEQVTTAIGPDRADVADRSPSSRGSTSCSK